MPSPVPAAGLQRKQRTLKSYAHLLAAVDLDESAELVIKRARELAEPTGGKVSLVHVVEPLVQAFGGDVPVDSSQRRQDQSDPGKEFMESFFKKYPDINCGGAHLVYGATLKEVHQLAKDQKCDLIVVGSQSRHGSALLGSSADDATHGAPCEVLAV